MDIKVIIEKMREDIADRERDKERLNESLVYIELEIRQKKVLIDQLKAVEDGKNKSS